MPKIKEIPQVDRPREKFLKKGPDALSKSDLLAIMLGSGIKGKNVKQLSEQIIKISGKNFLNTSVENLLKITGIGQSKALQIVAAISLVKRFYEEERVGEIVIRNSQSVFSLVYDLKDKKKENLLCLYLNARNALIKKEIISIGLLDKSLVHPREVFSPAIELSAASIALVHNHPSGDPTPSEKDIEVAKKISEAGELMGIPVIDFLIVASGGDYSLCDALKNHINTDYVAEGIQSVFELFKVDQPTYQIGVNKIEKKYTSVNKIKSNYFQLQNRRYLGNKYKLLGFIEDIVKEKCGDIESFCDIFAGTGVVGERFNTPRIKVISNDFLFSNASCLGTFLGTKGDIQKNIESKVDHLNNLEAKKDNYFSLNFGNTYFSKENARKIGAIRDEIEVISENEDEKRALVCSLLYAIDRVANTVGHYDAFRKKLDTIQPIKLLVPLFDYTNNHNNEVYKKDANELVRKIYCDVLYIDPPYNSRQYSDAYHLLENLAEWKKPELFGIAKKMDRSHIKSEYCLKTATQAFEDLIVNANCKHILLSYNNTGDSKDGRSNARIADRNIISILKKKGDVEIFEKDYRAFTTGKSNVEENIERIFYCKVYH